MGEFKNYKEQSKGTWGTYEDKLTLQQIQLGSVLRIADSLELIANNYSKLLSDIEYLRTRNKELSACTERLAKSNAALRGHLKRKKNVLGTKKSIKIK